MKIFEKMRDAAFRFIEREGDFTLHFFADFIRGHSSSEDKKKKKAKSEIPLSHSEQQIFRELLKRRKNEDQVEYWKRKKAMLNMEDKKSFVEQEIEARKKQESSKAKEQKIADERQKRKLEAQMKKIKAAKYDAIQKSESLSKKN